MRRSSVVLSLVVVFVLAVMAIGAQPRAVAQEATPASGEMSFEGLTFEPLAIVEGLNVPPSSELLVAHVSLDPGATLPSSESDPQDGLLIVESGTLTLRLEAPLTVSRSGSLGAAIATAVASGVFSPESEAFASGEEFTLEAGDSVYVPAHIAGEVRNDGQERAEALLILLGPPEPMAEATPTS
jgi:quercetin dioxygenase-like cupin family protein